MVARSAAGRPNSILLLSCARRLSAHQARRSRACGQTRPTNQTCRTFGQQFGAVTYCYERLPKMELNITLQPYTHAPKPRNMDALAIHYAATNKASTANAARVKTISKPSAFWPCSVVCAPSFGPDSAASLASTSSSLSCIRG